MAYHSVLDETNMMVEPLRHEEKEKLENWIASGSKIFDLLFSIKKHGCDSTTFHKLCDDKGPTVTVLYNTNNSVFGGYTSVAWKSLGRYRMDNTAFMFQLRYNGEQKINKFPHQDGIKAIYDDKDYGPYFGSGPDLFTFKKTVERSWMRTKETEIEYFRLNGKMKISTYDISACEKETINNGHMEVIDLEVYLVKDNPVTEWRNTDFTNTLWSGQTLNDLKGQIRKFSYPNEIKITQANILLIGPIGAGKSSFVNTICSTFEGYFATVANSGTAADSVTTKFRRYPTWMDSRPLPFVMCDTRGIEQLTPEVLRYILDGNVPDGYQFNTDAPFKMDFPESIRNPTLKDEIHCVALVIDGSQMNVMPPKTLETILQFKKTINQKNVPLLVLLTKVENVCSLVKNDLSMIFRSGAISILVENAATILGVPRGNVLPVKNCEADQKVENNLGILALLSLRQILRSSRGFIQMQSLLYKAGTVSV